jgi:hypothetical protein
LGKKDFRNLEDRAYAPNCKEMSVHWFVATPAQQFALIAGTELKVPALGKNA